MEHSYHGRCRAENSPVTGHLDSLRTVLRPFAVDYPPTYSTGDGSRTRAIVERVLSVEHSLVGLGLKRLSDLIESRHRDCRKVLLRRFEELEAFVPGGQELDDDRKLLIGAFFTEEYSL